MPKGYPNRELNVKTPGAAPAAADQERDAALDAAAEAALSDTSDVAVPAEPSPAMPATAPDLKAYIDSQIAAGIAAGMKTMKKAQANPAAPTQELKDQSEIDPHKISTMVLSKQGYVVPVNFGAAPAHIREAIQLGR